MVILKSNLSSYKGEIIFHQTIIIRWLVEVVVCVPIKNYSTIILPRFYVFFVVVYLYTLLHKTLFWHRFNVFHGRHGRQMDFETTLCTYWVSISQILSLGFKNKDI